MDLCCCSFPGPDSTAVTTNYSYPGKRPNKLYKTAGNALSASPQYNNSNNNNNNNNNIAPDGSLSGTQKNDLVAGKYF